MAKRMIDADAFLEWVNKKAYSAGNNYWGLVEADKLIQKIQELSTPAPEPQESVFDEDGWCRDMGKAPRNEKFLAFFRFSFLDYVPLQGIINYCPAHTMEYWGDDDLSCIEIFDDKSPYYFKEGFYFMQFERNRIDFTMFPIEISDIIAWCPLPPIPQKGDL